MPIRITPAVKFLAIGCVVGFLVQQTADQFFGQQLIQWFGLVPAGIVVHFRLWQIFTYVFLHGEVLQLFLNLMMLVLVGSELEGLWGRARFLRYYFFCSTAAAVAYLLMQFFMSGSEGLHYPMIGATGAIYGLLVAYGIIFGERVLLFMMIFPMKAKNFVWILAGLELMTSIYSGRGGLATAVGFAHLGGMVAGFAYLWGKATWTVMQRRRKSEVLEKFLKWSPLDAWGDRKKRGKGHLKLVIDNKKKKIDKDAPKSGKPSDSFEEEDRGDHDPKTWH